MSKLYIFGIGGTGSRVLKSLTMLLASGVQCKGEIDTIVPIIIDPDASAANLTSSVASLRHYNNIRAKLSFTNANKNKFFSTEIKEDFAGFVLPLQNTQNKLFNQFIGLQSMKRENQAMMNMLFSQDNLNADMNVGFKGNPNIGSVVLNQFSQTQQFLDFANGFVQGDKIFIISSIFGGTGASGFPLLAKLLRSNKTLPNFNIINQAHIGAITVMPYFNVTQNPKSAIDSSTFLSKTRAALTYYEKNLKEVDDLYYIADDIRANYDNNEGGDNQKNDAHIIEFLSALAILDFTNSTQQPTPTYKEYGLQYNVGKEVIFSDLGKKSLAIVRKSLTQFMLFCNYFKNVEQNRYLKKVWTETRKLDENFFSSDFMEEVFQFQNDFRVWLSEMNKNNRSFSPFELENTKNTFEIVKGVMPKKKIINIKSITMSNYDLFDSFLNSAKTQPQKAEEQFADLFYSATEALIDKKFNF